MSLTPRTAKRPTVHQKKRAGDHQTRNKHFHKAYWPYLPLMCVAAVVVIVLGAWAIGPTGAVMGTVAITVASIAVIL